MLNRLLIFRSAPYCSSLLHTYAIYSISLVLLTTLGAILIRVAHINPRLIACFTLPGSGILNYFLLQRCLDGNGAATTTMPERERLERSLLMAEKHMMMNNVGGGGSGGTSGIMMRVVGGGGGGVGLTGTNSPGGMAAANSLTTGVIGIGGASDSPSTGVSGGSAGTSSLADGSLPHSQQLQSSASSLTGNAIAVSGMDSNPPSTLAGVAGGVHVGIAPHPSPYGGRRFTVNSGANY